MSAEITAAEKAAHILDDWRGGERVDGTAVHTKPDDLLPGGPDVATATKVKSIVADYRGE